MIQKFILLTILLIFANCAYEPELMLTGQPAFLNKLVANYSDTIIQKINKYHIPDITNVTQKVSGVTVSVSLSKITQKVKIHWMTNVVSVVDRHTFKINSKNINITLNAHVEAKVSNLPKQKGPLVVQITQLEADTQIMFDNPKCPKSFGFDVQIKDIYVDMKKVDVKITGKGFDNLVIKQVQKILVPRIPGILKSAASQQINPLLSDLTCTRIQEQIQISNKFYMLILNTTEVPAFDTSLRYIRFLVDVTFQNMLTNQTNNQLERDDLPDTTELSPLFDLSLAASSNFLNTVIWLVGDAQLLDIAVTNDMLGDNPPISLNTTNLSILLPNLKTKEWANKEVFLLITPSTKFQHLLVRSGRIVTVLSLSVKFVVNVTETIQDRKQCIEEQGCVVACDLNMTLPLSMSLNLNISHALGLLHSVSFYDAQVIDSKIDVNVKTFKSILNSIVGSMIPSLNSQLVTGFELPEIITNITQEYRVTGLEVRSYLDYLAAGISIQV